MTVSKARPSSSVSASSKVWKSLGAFSRPTLTSSGRAVSSGRLRGRSSSIPFWMTTVRSDRQVLAASPSRRSVSETQMTAVVNRATSRSAHR